jgi:molecular chaperone DnaJ
VARDLYEVLGVRRDAGGDEIKQAYRALARELHPDTAEGDATRFGELSDAYEILSNEESRRLYDRLGWRGKGQGIAPKRGLARVYASNPRALFEDLESMLASAAGRRPEKEPRRVVAEVEIDPYEAHLGATREVAVEDTKPCEGCDGTGRRRAVSHNESGRYLALDACDECGGAGRVGAERPVQVTVPPRARDLDRIPLGPEEVAIVRIVPPRDRAVIRFAAALALTAAIGFLLFLLAL